VSVGGAAGDPGETGRTGTASEEAARLFEAVQDWARRTSGGEHRVPLATGSPECQLCPVCQLIGLLRATRPETVEHLAEAAAALVAALRSVITAHEHEWSRRRPDPVERIDIG